MGRLLKGFAMTATFTRPLMLAGMLIATGSISLGSAAGAEPAVRQKGTASFYSDKFHGRTTASGKRFDQKKPTAASKTLPLGSKAKVTNLETGQTTEVEITDRGPSRRTVDLSKEAAAQVGLEKKEGVAPVKVEAKPSEQPNERAKEAVQAKAARSNQRK